MGDFYKSLEVIFTHHALYDAIRKCDALPDIDGVYLLPTWSVTEDVLREARSEFPDLHIAHQRAWNRGTWRGMLHPTRLRWDFGLSWVYDILFGFIPFPRHPDERTSLIHKIFPESFSVNCQEFDKESLWENSPGYSEGFYACPGETTHRKCLDLHHLLADHGTDVARVIARQLAPEVDMIQLHVERRSLGHAQDLTCSIPDEKKLFWQIISDIDAVQDRRVPIVIEGKPQIFGRDVNLLDNLIQAVRNI